MEENNKGGYTAEGRKLRPRRPRISGTHSSSEGQQRSEYGSRPHRSYSDNDSRSHGNSGNRPSYRTGSHEGGSGYGHRDNGSYGHREGGNGYGHRDNGGNYGDRPRSYGNRNNGGSSYGRRDGDTRSFSGNGEGARRPAGRGGFDNNRPQRGGVRNNVRGGAPKKAFNKSAKPKRENPYKFSEIDEQNINTMISHRPQLDASKYSDNDTVKTPIKDEVRLNKFIANSGVCSRREADQLIQAGVVTVNGEVITELGVKINPFKDEIRFNGERLKGEEKVYIVMNKPKGFVTTASDPHADKTVMDLLKNCQLRVFPVGRLDKNTTGVLMFTNDGEIAEKLTHPSYDKKKIYQVILDKPIAEEDFNKVVEGITLSDGDIKADDLQYIDPDDHRKLGIEIHSGKNRIVRRIFEAVGYEVKALDRVYFAGLTKKGLKKGEWRYLTQGEANVLRMGSYV